MKLTPWTLSRAFPCTVQTPGREPETYHGRIAITWPKATGHGIPLLPWSLTIHDYDTGEQMLNVNGLQISLGGERWGGELITAELNQLVDEQGQPLPKGSQPVLDPEDPDRVRTGVFRYYVVEMRTAQ